MMFAVRAKYKPMKIMIAPVIFKTVKGSFKNSAAASVAITGVKLL